MKRLEKFTHPVYYLGELVALAPSEVEATRMMTSFLHSGMEVGALDLEVVPPPPPSPLPTGFVGDSGIPSDLFENGASTLTAGLEQVQLKEGVEGIEQLAAIKASHDIVSKHAVGGKVLLFLRKRV